mmetsp:Transcript_14938/g.22478  ORF Transcript_14938/g.22478 Transcript_14938/m.22478 type:complete len:146 (+) Transcript_14938:53-490(+)
MEEEPFVRRFAIKYSPPTLVVEYKSGSSIFLKKIRIKKRKNITEERICDKLMEMYPSVLGPDKIDKEQLLDLIKLLLTDNGSEDLITDDVDLNKVDDEKLMKAKAQMDVNFEKHRILPGDPGYVWDKQVEFEEGDEDCDWDEDSD